MGLTKVSYGGYPAYMELRPIPGKTENRQQKGQITQTLYR